MKAWFFLWVLLGLFSPFVQGIADEKEFEVVITPAASTVSINDFLTVHLRLTFPAGYQIDLKKLHQNLLRSSSFYEHPFTLVEMKIKNLQERAKGRFSQEIVLILQPRRLGELFLTFYDIDFIAENKSAPLKKIVSEIYPIKVTAPEITSQIPEDFAALLTFEKKLPMELSEENQKLLLNNPSLQKQEVERNIRQMHEKQLPWIQIGCFILITLYLCFFLKSFSIKKPLTSKQLAKIAKKSALAELRQLRSKQLPAKGLFDNFYVHLTDTLRTYIQKKYHIPAATSTTPEFLAEVAQSLVFSSSFRQQLAHFLQQADRVKFERYSPNIEECEIAYKLAIQFIQDDPI
ncbi:Uncharacterized protein DB42_EA00890 [Neochlamydia sp. EPS4]|uniref:hypothetical protein n=1 Tax=Neochlamydia sp. EPS4 TaxID=1478175 RepID=UPI0005838EA1|nr:hypothetical protein [Neochlamydia sp. EPS4]KIC76217.1 Uncharacterized protein DB42_EA00890 [Neochlamydia sp. EPS4]